MLLLQVDSLQKRLRWVVFYRFSDKSLGFADSQIFNLTFHDYILTGSLSGHLKSEGDASITRGDFLAPTMDSNCASYPTFFQQLLDLACQTNGCNINMATLAAHQNNRKLHSIATNPNYFSPAFAGVG